MSECFLTYLPEPMYPSFITTAARRLCRSSVMIVIFVSLLGCGVRSTHEASAVKHAEAVPVEPTSPKLRVQISGARSKTGNFVCALFANSDDFANRANPVASASLPVTQSAWIITDLPAGRYAAAIFHDENLDTKLNRHGLGYPLEPYGFSNNARGRFGPPHYEDAAFSFQDQNLKIKIDLR